MNLSNGWGIVALVLMVAIIFVKAGQLGKRNGGAQSVDILKAAGGAGSNLVSALEGGGNPSLPVQARNG